MNRWDPVNYFDDMQNRMNQMMRSVLPQMESGMSAWTPSGDLHETDESYEIKLELPGVKRDDISIELNDRDMSITGEFKEHESHGHKRHSTRRTGQFEYAVRLPHSVDRENISAQLNDGVLQVTVPKAKESKPTHIEIQAS